MKSANPDLGKAKLTFLTPEPQTSGQSRYTAEEHAQVARHKAERIRHRKKLIAEGLCPQCAVPIEPCCPECHTPLAFWDDESL
jgi:hypothetical protein